MKQIAPLMIIGNKRSGSTQLMRLLNLHPEIHVTNESDVVWILHQFYQGNAFEAYPYDAPAGMRVTLEKYQVVLDPQKSYAENYINLQLAIMKGGAVKNQPVDKPQIKYLGDQKPYQNCDPHLLQELLDAFPNARFIHLYLHPFSVTDSSLKFEKGTGGYNWGGKESSQILSEWALFETWVHQACDNQHISVLNLKYEDLIDDPRREMKKVFEWLGLKSDQMLLRNCEKITLKNYKAHHRYLDISQDVRKLMKIYGFPERSFWLESVVVNNVRRYCHSVLRKLKGF